MLLSIVLSLKVLFILIVLTSGQPIERDFDENSVEENVPDIPKWHNHCKPEPSQSLLSPDSNGFELIQEYMQKVEKTALIAMKRANMTKSKFVSTYFLKLIKLS